MKSYLGTDDELPNFWGPQWNKILAELTLQGRWEKVVEIYRKFPEAHTATIKESMGTALHVAIEFNKEKFVDQLVEAIIIEKHRKEEQPRMIPEGLEKAEQRTIPEVLEKAINGRGDTPLHVAASRGFPRLCKLIVGPEKQRAFLAIVKNKVGETPLFQAALAGSRAAFAYLSDISPDPVVVARDLVRDNGDSILHCAIKREFIDLAVIIVDRYPLLCALTNNDGFTPLKVLATRPSAFRSGSSISWWLLILYHCIFVEPLDVERTMKKLLEEINEKQPPSFPMNYETLCEFWRFINFRPLGKLCGKILENDPQHDTEDPRTRVEDGFLPSNYTTFQQFFRSAYVSALGLSGVGLEEIRETKAKHTWSRQLLDALMKEPYEAYIGSGGHPSDLLTDYADDHSDILNNAFAERDSTEQPVQKETSSQKALDRTEPDQASEATDTDSKETPLLLAVKNGISEMVIGVLNKLPSILHDTNTKKENMLLVAVLKETDSKDTDSKETLLLLAAKNGISEMVIDILDKLPSTLHDTNTKKENVLLVAVLNRQPLVVETLRKKVEPEVWNNLILAEDEKENTMLHLAAQAQGKEKHKQIAGSALQMMWDIKWYEYIKSIVPKHFCFRVNKEKKTGRDIFTESHKDLVEDGSTWLKDTSESCSVVAALVAGLSFATATTVPGGNNDKGEYPLEGEPAFNVFAISSLVGLCFSATGLIMFLTILTSRKEARDFQRALPMKLLLGLSSLFVSIAAMFVSFCSGHIFNVNHKYKNILVPIYAATSLPVAFYALAQLPLYIDLLITIYGKVPLAKDEGDKL